MAKVKTDRREFIKYSTLGVLGLVLAGGVGLSPYLLADEMRLRPPGAVDEKEFLGLCIKCGQCLQVCPYHSIELADWGKGHGIGTPYIDATFLVYLPVLPGHCLMIVRNLKIYIWG